MKNKPDTTSTPKLTNIITILNLLRLQASTQCQLHWLHDNNFKSASDHASSIWSHQVSLHWMLLKTNDKE